MQVSVFIGAVLTAALFFSIGELAQALLCCLLALLALIVSEK